MGSSPINRNSITMFALALGFAFVAAISADGPPAYGPAPVYAPAPSYEKEVPQPYQYQYGVQDDYSGANFAASENSDAKVVTGSYTDHYNGYVADVTYEGTPVYPEAKPYAPPKYAPAPPKYAPAPPKYAPAPP